MRLVSFYDPVAGPTWGSVADDRVFAVGRADNADLGKALAKLGGSLEKLTTRVFDRLEGQEEEASVTVLVYGFDELDVPPDSAIPHLKMPIEPAEVWGCGVTYKRSADERDADAEKDIYSQVYESERPEVFFKAPPRCCVGPNEPICIRADSKLTAAEPELAVVVGVEGAIVGYTICNDVSAWDIERANPLYLPQSKTFEGCCALGPVVVTTEEIEDPYALEVRCRILRDGKVVFNGGCNTSQMGRRIEDLIGYLTRNNPVPVGTILTTGTGIMIPNECALKDGDRVDIEIEGIGILRNPVRQL